MRAGWIAAFAISAGLSGAARAEGEPCAACVDGRPDQEAYPPPPPIQRPLDLGPGEARPASAPRQRDVLFRGELGAVYTHALERSFGGARVDVEVGRDFSALSVGGRLGFEAGATQSRLAYQRLSWGVGVDGKAGRARFGLEPRIGALMIDRRSTSDVMAALTLGAHGECIVALIGPERPTERSHAGLDLVMRLGYDWIETTNARPEAAHSVSAKLGIGGRF